MLALWQEREFIWVKSKGRNCVLQCFREEMLTIWQEREFIWVNLMGEICVLQGFRE